MKLSTPPINGWLEDIRRGSESGRIGMYLIHNGVVRGTSRSGSPVSGMNLSFDQARLEQAVGGVVQMPGIVAVRAWVNEGRLAVGDDIMYVLVAGDIRENVFRGLEELVRRVKTEVVKEQEFV